MTDSGAAKARRYHHGDLPRALLSAAESELAENGVEGFSLRKVATRAGVSHAAPSHHFRDSAGLLTRLAVIGFERFLAAQDEAAKPYSDPVEQLIASGEAYVLFAVESPALFRLMFDSNRLDRRHEALQRVATRANTTLLARVAALPSLSGAEPEALQAAANRIWALVHGVSSLWIGGHLASLSELEAQARRRALREILEPEIARPHPVTA